MEVIRFSGRVQTGQGKAASFTQVPWVQKSFLENLGVRPYAGTLNLIVSDDLSQWERLRAREGIALSAPDSSFCAARCYPVRIRGRWPAAIVLPEVSNYPPQQVELIAGFPLRKTLSLEEGDSVEIVTNRPLSARALVFDLDGTLVDSLEAYYVCAQKAVDGLNLKLTRESVRRFMNGEYTSWDEFLGSNHAACDPEVQAKLEKDARRHFPEAFSTHARLFPDLADILLDLKAVGFRLGLVTGSGPIVLGPLREAGLLELFCSVVTNEDVQLRKPHPQGLLNCLESLEVQPAQAVYIGDSVIDIKTAQAAGTSSVAVLTGAGDCASLAVQGPEWITSSLDQLLNLVSLGEF